jgi:uncharacterized protein (DUF1697 family)
MGFDDPVTFRASGNVIFDVADGEDAITSRIEQHLEKSLGYAVPSFVRSAAEVRAIAAHEPFEAAAVAASAGKLQVGLLKAKPSTGARKKVLALATDEDRLAIRGRELYWLPSGGLLESPLDLKAIDAALGETTRRTMGTMEQIAAQKLGN